MFLYDGFCFWSLSTRSADANKLSTPRTLTSTLGPRSFSVCVPMSCHALRPWLSHWVIPSGAQDCSVCCWLIDLWIATCSAPLWQFLLNVACQNSCYYWLTTFTYLIWFHEIVLCSRPWLGRYEKDARTSDAGQRFQEDKVQSIALSLCLNCLLVDNVFFFSTL